MRMRLQALGPSLEAANMPVVGWAVWSLLEA